MDYVKGILHRELKRITRELSRNGSDIDRLEYDLNLAKEEREVLLMQKNQLEAEFDNELPTRLEGSD